MSEAIEANVELVESLDAAQKGDPAAVVRFYELLIEADIFVPLRKVSDPDKVPQGKILTLGDPGQVPLLVEHEGKRIIPIFTHQELIEAWSQRDMFSVERRFKNMLQLGTDDVWLHLNPGCEVGKEISPWEIERLRDGSEAIPEVVAEVMPAADTAIEVQRGHEQFPELITHLKVLLEVYPQVEEAFLITVKRESANDAEPVLGLKHTGLSDEQISSIEEEIQGMAINTGSSTVGIGFVTDLANRTSPNWTLFEDATPFYIAQQKLKRPSRIGGFFSKFKK